MITTGPLELLVVTTHLLELVVFTTRPKFVFVYFQGEASGNKA